MQTYFIFPFVPVTSYAYSIFFYDIRKHPIKLNIKKLKFFSTLTFERNNDYIKPIFFDYFWYLSRSVFTQLFNKNTVKCFGIYCSFFFSTKIFIYFTMHIRFNNSLCLPYSAVNPLFISFLFGKIYFTVLEFLFFFKLKQLFC